MNMLSDDFAQQLLSEYGNAWITQDSDKILAIFTPDGTYYDPEMKRILNGYGEIRKYWETRIKEDEANITFKVLRYYICKETIIAEWLASFDYLPDRSRVSIQEIAILEIQDNKIKSLREYWIEV